MRGLTDEEFAYLRALEDGKEGEIFYDEGDLDVVGRSCQEMGLVARIWLGKNEYEAEMLAQGQKALRVEEACRKAGVV